MTKLRSPLITSSQQKEMLALAESARTKTYPKSGSYGVAVLAESGKMYEGISYISDTYTLTMHSEATALAHASIHGEINILAITGPNCHICKQLIWERSLNTGIDIAVVIEEEGFIKTIPISKLMLYPWPDINGKH